ncbi:MAG: polysaccharide biosynthesis C-terminal domain-containing protein [Chlorobium sp.]|jgi:O-antigen/teichoic acid export membrane protein|nr:polysaccharide biosynthesis C-terminal domain-containing protein [Chlorobium sp.]
MNQKENAHKKLAGNAVSGMVATIIYMVSRLLLTPFILQYLSLEEFGLWSLCFIILSYAGMGGFGVNSTYIRYSARYLAEGKEKEISKLLSTGVAYMFTFCLFFCLVLYLIMPFLLERFHIAPAQQDLAATIFLGTAAVFSLELTLGGFRFVINGMHEFLKEKIVSTVAGLIEIGAILLFLYFGAGVKGLLYAFALRLVLETIGCWAIARSLLPSLSVSWRLISRENFRLFLGFGGKVQVLGILGIFLTALDRLFITAIAGLAAGGMFEIGRKLPSTAGGISSSAFGPFLSTASHIEGRWAGEKPDAFPDRLKTYALIVATTVTLSLVPLFFLLPVQKRLPGTSPLIAVFAGVLTVILFYLLNRRMKNEKFLDSIELKQLYLNGIRFTNMINSTLFLFLVAMAHPLMNAWVGKEYASAADVMIFLSTAYSIQLCTGPITMIFRGIDRNGRELEYMLVQVILMVIWIPAGTIAWGLIGSAAAIACSSIVSTLFLFWRSNNTFRIRFRKFVPFTVIPALVPLLPAVAVFAVSEIYPAEGRLMAVLQVLVCGVVYVVLSVMMFWKYVLNGEEKSKALEMIPFNRKRNPPC